MYRLKKLRYIHSRSAEYYGNLNIKFFKTTISITAISGIGAFLSTSNFFNSETKTALNIGVGVLSFLSTMIQTLANGTVDKVEIESHKVIANEYSNLINILKLEMEMPNSVNFYDELEMKILDIQNKCKYIPPQFIFKEWTKNKKQILTESLSDINQNDNIILSPEIMV